MVVDKDNFLAQWADFMSSMSDPFAFSRSETSESKQNIGDFWGTAEESYQTLLSHYDRLMSFTTHDHSLPKLDTFMGYDLKLRDMGDAYTDLIEAITQLNLLSIQAATSAFAKADLTPFDFDSARGTAMSDWQGAIDASIVEMQRSDAYLAAKSEYVSCLTRFQKHYRSLVESGQEYNHTPTLTEFEDLSKTVHELKREVWALKKRLS